MSDLVKNIITGNLSFSESELRKWIQDYYERDNRMKWFSETLPELAVKFEKKKMDPEELKISLEEFENTKYVDHPEWFPLTSTLQAMVVNFDWSNLPFKLYKIYWILT